MLLEEDVNEEWVSDVEKALENIRICRRAHPSSMQKICISETGNDPRASKGEYESSRTNCTTFLRNSRLRKSKSRTQ